MDSGQGARCILIVEDEGTVRQIMAMLLQHEGYTVLSAENGQEALERLRSTSPPDVILLDLMMPVMDGRQFRAEQQRDPSLASIPIILVTAAGHGQDTAASLGAVRYLPKPVDFQDLLSMIRECCSSSSP